MSKFYKLEIYVPETHIDEVKNSVFAAGAGVLGNYDCCSWETAGTGQFRPKEGSKPFIGSLDEVERVLEHKIEMICRADVIDNVIKALKEAHPYETPAYQYWQVNI